MVFKNGATEISSHKLGDASTRKAILDSWNAGDAEFNQTLTGLLDDISDFTFQDGSISGTAMVTRVVQELTPAMTGLYQSLAVDVYDAWSLSDSNYSYERGQGQIVDSAGNDSLIVNNLENVLFYKSDEYGDLTIYSLDEGRATTFSEAEFVRLGGWYTQYNGQQNAGVIETINLTESGVTLDPSGVAKLVEATAQFMAINGISDIESVNINEYRDQLSGLTASALV